MDTPCMDIPRDGRENLKSTREGQIGADDHFRKTLVLRILQESVSRHRLLDSEATGPAALRGKWHSERDSGRVLEDLLQSLAPLCENYPLQKLPLSREEESVHDHRKKIFWGTSLAPKKNFPGRWWIQKPYKTRKTISTTEIFPFWPQFFGAKRSSSLEQATPGKNYPLVSARIQPKQK